MIGRAPFTLALSLAAVAAAMHFYAPSPASPAQPAAVAVQAPTPQARPASDESVLSRVEAAPPDFVGGAGGGVGPLDGVRLTGIVFDGTRGSALIASVGSEARTVRLNDEVLGWRVTRITASEVALRSGQREHVLRLFENRIVQGSPPPPPELVTPQPFRSTQPTAPAPNAPPAPADWTIPPPR